MGQLSITCDFEWHSFQTNDILIYDYAMWLVVPPAHSYVNVIKYYRSIIINFEIRLIDVHSYIHTATYTVQLCAVPVPDVLHFNIRDGWECPEKGFQSDDELTQNNSISLSSCLIHLVPRRTLPRSEKRLRSLRGVIIHHSAKRMQFIVKVECIRHYRKTVWLVIINSRPSQSGVNARNYIPIFSWHNM